MANTQTTVPAFVASQVLTAEEMTQSASTGVPVFATTVTRDAGFGGSGQKALAQGQLCYLEATDVVQYYDGSAWATLAPAAPAAASALTFISSTTCVSATVTQINNCFSSSYDNYLINFTNITGVSYGNGFQARLGTSGTPDSTSVYASGDSSWAGLTTQLSLMNGPNNAGAAMSFAVNLFGPNLANKTFGAGQYLYYDSSVAPKGFYVNTSTQYTDFTIITTTPTGGTIKIYGYANS